MEFVEESYSLTESFLTVWVIIVVGCCTIWKPLIFRSRILSLGSFRWSRILSLGSFLCVMCCLTSCPAQSISPLGEMITITGEIFSHHGFPFCSTEWRHTNYLYPCSLMEPNAITLEQLQDYDLQY
ncbi:hypothetical protein ACH5RR_039564 [Cinchona calisaya]|uniref:Uncharacterized protein n=1 Tax=Cinchona calisaya TaxID=153742 RepID=A0ABD2Y156_9GENT